MQQFASLLRGQNRRMEEETAFAQVSLAWFRLLRPARSEILLTALRLWQMHAALSIVRHVNCGQATKAPTESREAVYQRFPTRG